MIRHILRHTLCLCACLVATAFIAKAQTPPYNEIWYTTTDGRPLFINSGYKKSVGLYMYSDTYNNGRGVLKFESGSYINFINSGLFYHNDRLKSITIPNSVTSIGEYAFADCSSLKSITIPKSVTSIGRSAFYNCSSLTSITIGNSVTWIEENAFGCCSSLKSITIGNSLISISHYGAFYWCHALKDVNVNITNLAEYCKRNSIYKIPGNKHLYINNKEITELVIPNSVTEIGYSAFNGCSSLKSITIPNSVTSIRECAFKDCSSLKSVKVSNKYCYDYFKELGVSDITFAVSTPKEYGEAQKLGATKLAIDSNSKYASKDGLCLIDNGKLILFIGKDLTEYTIPESITSIGYGAFKDCSSLKSFKGKYASSDGRCLIIDGELIAFAPAGLTSYTIPNSVTSIGEYAFADCSSLKSVKVANKYCYDYFKGKVANIAFYGANASDDGRCLIIDGKLKIFIANGITEYTIPESVKSIESLAFEGCSSLTSITIPNSVTSIEYGAFEGCSSLTSITIPNSVTSIEYEAFRGCSSLTSIAIPNSVTSIGEYAFADCSSLKSITIPESVKSIEGRAFEGCSSLTSITIPDSVTSIGNYAFKGCCSLTSITIPNSVTSIGHDAFRGCSSLTSITIPNSITSIGNYAFNGCSNLKSVKVANKYCYDYFKDKVANIAFYGANASDDGRCLIIDGELKIFIAKGITEYTIPNSVTSIGESAFRSCSSLTSITIPNSVKSIDSWAFRDCSSLTSITIPNSVTSIEYGAFDGCSSLTSITIPNSVKSIKFRAFAGCSSLTSITCLATMPPAIDDLSIAETTMIYVPKKGVKAYKKDPKWSIYKKQIKPIK